MSKYQNNDIIKHSLDLFSHGLAVQDFLGRDCLPLPPSLVENNIGPSFRQRVWFDYNRWVSLPRTFKLLKYTYEPFIVLYIVGWVNILSPYLYTPRDTLSLILGQFWEICVSSASLSDSLIKVYREKYYKSNWYIKEKNAPKIQIHCPNGWHYLKKNRAYLFNTQNKTPGELFSVVQRSASNRLLFPANLFHQDVLSYLIFSCSWLLPIMILLRNNKRCCTARRFRFWRCFVVAVVSLMLD